MPKKIDREAHAAAVLPAAVRLVAEEGLAAASYRRVAEASGLSLAAVRNMWETQEKLLQRASASLKHRLFASPEAFGVTRRADGVLPEAPDYLRAHLLALLPLTPDAREAHRAWQVFLANAPFDSRAHQVAEMRAGDRLSRIVRALDGAAWLRLPEPRPSRVVLAQDLVGLTPDNVGPAALQSLTLVAGLSSLLIDRRRPLAPEAAVERVTRSVPCLLDLPT